MYQFLNASESTISNMSRKQGYYHLLSLQASTCTHSCVIPGRTTKTSCDIQESARLVSFLGRQMDTVSPVVWIVTLTTSPSADALAGPFEDVPIHPECQSQMDYEVSELRFLPLQKLRQRRSRQ